MKKTLSFLALAALLAGCSSDDRAVTAKSPWSNDGSSGTSGNPIARSVAGAPAPRINTPVERGTYSWDANKPAATAESAALVAPTESGKALIADIRGDLGLLALLLAEKPAPGQTFIVIKDNKPARIRIVELDGEIAIAELPPNQVDIPTLAVGEQVTLVLESATEV